MEQIKAASGTDDETKLDPSTSTASPSPSRDSSISSLSKEKKSSKYKRKNSCKDDELDDGNHYQFRQTAPPTDQNNTNLASSGLIASQLVSLSSLSPIEEKGFHLPANCSVIQQQKQMKQSTCLNQQQQKSNNSANLKYAHSSQCSSSIFSACIAESGQPNDHQPREISPAQLQQQPNQKATNIHWTLYQNDLGYFSTEYGTNSGKQPAQFFPLIPGQHFHQFGRQLYQSNNDVNSHYQQPMQKMSTQPQQHPQQYHKKISKPMIEKRRRDRINRCLSLLKEIIIDSKRYPVANVSKIKTECFSCLVCVNLNLKYYICTEWLIYL